jgi:hypothetical protein
VAGRSKKVARIFSGGVVCFLQKQHSGLLCTVRQNQRSLALDVDHDQARRDQPRHW